MTFYHRFCKDKKSKDREEEMELITAMIARVGESPKALVLDCSSLIRNPDIMLFRALGGELYFLK